MPFTTHPQVAPRRSGRRLRYVLAAVAVVAALAIAAQSWWFHLFGKEEQVETVQPKPAPTYFGRYDLPEDQPAPEVVPAALTAAREPQPRRQVQRTAQRAEPRRIQTREEVYEPKDVAWKIDSPEIEREWFQDGRLEMVAEGCALRPGVSVIPARLITAINSEIPGQVIAEVTETVYSPDAGYGNKELVLQGARIVGVVDKQQRLNLDRRRLPVVWTQMTDSRGFGDPSVTQVALAESFGASADGSMGMGGRVEQRYGQLAVYALLSTVFNWSQRQVLDGEDDIIVDLGNEAGATAGRIGEEVLEKSLDWEPTISIDGGTQVRILPAKTVRVCRRRPSRRRGTRRQRGRR